MALDALSAGSGVADAPVVDTPEIDTPEITDAGDGGDGGNDADGLEPVTSNELGDNADADPAKAAADAALKGDARTLPAELKKSLAELTKTNPKLAEIIRKDYFKARQYEGAFKTPQEAKQVADTLASLEGLNGETGLQAIEALQADAQEFNDEITAFAGGDPALLDKLEKSNPGAIAKLVPHALKLMSAEDRSKMMDSEMDSTFTANNVYSHVDLLLKAIMSDDPGARAEAKRLAAGLQGWLQTKQGKANAPVDKDRAALQTERQQWEQERAETQQREFESKMYGDLNPIVTNKVVGYLTNLLPKGYKLPEATQNRILQTIFGQIDAKLQEKPDYLTRAEAIFKTKDLKRVTNFMVSRIDPLLLPLTKTVFNEFRGIVPQKAAPKAGVQKAGAQGNAPAAKGVQARKPSLSEALGAGFTKEEWLNGLSKKKLEKNGKTYFAW